MRNILRLGLPAIALSFATLGLADLGVSQCTLQTVPPGPGGPTAYNDELAVSGPFLALRAGSGTEVDVFEDVAGTWQLRANLTGFDFVDALDLDGDRLAIGVGDPSGSNDAVHVYERQGSSWHETEVLVPADPPNSTFGNAVALAGTTLLVGDTTANNSGSVLQFEVDPGGTWALVDTLTAPVPQEGAGFGFKLALDGDTLMISEATVIPGRVHVFENENGAFESKQVIVGPIDDSGLGFGFNIAIDADVAAVGSPVADIVSTFGSAWALERIGGSWTVTQTLSPPQLTAFDQFGVDVSVEDGRIAVASSNEGPTGAAYVFEKDGSWTVAQSITGNALFGLNSVELSNKRLFVSGAPVRVLDPLGATTFCAAKTNSQGCVPSIDLSGQVSPNLQAPAIVSAADVLSQRNGLFFYGIDGPAALPFQGGSLCAQPPLRRTSLLNSGGDGTFCSGSYAFDLNAWIQGANDPNLVAASRVIGQFWSRDPGHPDGTGAGLTNAIDLLICQ